MNKNIIVAVSYITWIGFIIALVKGDRSDRFIAHHMNQALVINLAGIAGGVLTVIPVLGAMAAGIISTATIVFDIMGVITAYRGSMDPLPLIGDIHIL